MKRPYGVTFRESATRQIQRERVWLVNHRGLDRADDFEEELRHAVDLLAECPDMGDASPDSPARRHWFLVRSRFHVFYIVDHGRGEIRVTSIRHEKQRPLKR